MNGLRFKLVADHVTLLRSAVIRWEDCEFGAPAIDCKRPYGNSDVIRDMAEILGVELIIDTWGDEVVAEADADRLRELHNETETALQIILKTGSFEPGIYERPETWRNDWKRVR